MAGAYPGDARIMKVCNLLSSKLRLLNRVDRSVEVLTSARTHSVVATREWSYCDVWTVDAGRARHLQRDDLRLPAEWRRSAIGRLPSDVPKPDRGRRDARLAAGARRPEGPRSAEPDLPAAGDPRW